MSSLRDSLPNFVTGIKTLSDYESLIAVVLGLINGAMPEVKFGHNELTAITETDIWERGDTQPIYIFPDVAGETIELLSDNIGDNQIITIEGLDVDYLAQTQFATLNGTTPVPVPGTWVAVNRAYNDTGTRFLGNVITRGDGSTSANIFTSMDTAAQQTAQAITIIPDDKVGILNNFSTAINKSGGASITCIFSLQLAKFGKVFRTQIRYGLQKEGTSNISSDLIIPVLVAPKSRVKITALPDAINTDVSGEFSFILVDKNLVPADILSSI